MEQESRVSVFEDGLQCLISQYSMEGKSKTPDYVLAAYLRDCLDAFSRAVKARDRYDREMKVPGEGGAA
jgi:hypothetical protein